MNSYVLKPFSAPPEPFMIYVESSHVDDQLEINFTLMGDMTSLHLPSPAENSNRVVGLYHHTCLEIFLKRGSRYLEWNFSFSGDWCIFLFDSYRKKSTEQENLDSSLFSIKHISHSNSEARFGVGINLDRLNFLGRGESHLGFSAVLEHPKSQLSYWALKHVANQPDFHQEKSFIVTL